MFGIGFGELILLFVIIILVLGPKDIVSIAKKMAILLKSFQKFKDDLITHIKNPNDP